MPLQEGGQPRGPTLTFCKQGPAVHAAPKALGFTEGRGPAKIAVTVAIIVAHLEGGVWLRCQHHGQRQPPNPAAGAQVSTYPVAMTLSLAAFHWEEGGVSALALEADLRGWGDPTSAHMGDKQGG